MACMAVKVLQVCSVGPQEGETTTTPPTSLPLTLFDTPGLRVSSTDFLFLYDYKYPNSNSNTLFDVVIPTLKHSLSITLQYFFPLAGNIIWPHDSSIPIISYVPGDSASFTVAELSNNNADDDDLFNQLSSNLCEGEQRHTLVPRLNKSREKASILAIQVTLFPNAGFSVGITTHHGALDGISAMLFFKAWAYVSCSNLFKEGQKPSSSLSATLPHNLTPSFDRSMISDPSGLAEVYAKGFTAGETINRSLEAEEINIGPVGEDAVKGTFQLTPSHIQKLKQYAESHSKITRSRLSSFSVTVAYLVSCLAKVEQPINERVAFIYAVDCRHRLETPMKPTYCGNCIVPHIGEVETRALLGDDGFINALVAITDELSSLEGGLVNVAENWMSKLLSVFSDRIISFTMSPRLQVYDVDFGWGRPKKVDIPSVDRTGAFSLLKSRDHDGGIEVGLALYKSQMEAFAQLFAQGLESL